MLPKLWLNSVQVIFMYICIVIIFISLPKLGNFLMSLVAQEKDKFSSTEKRKNLAISPT